MNIIFIGDVVGKPGRESLRNTLPELRKRYEPGLVIANGENVAGGAGINEKTYREILSCGVDVVTGGNHTWDRKEVFQFIDKEVTLIRPANLPEKTTPGRGVTIFKTAKGQYTVAVINLQGRVFMTPVDCPFSAADRELEKLAGKVNAVIVDFHAEATSEKEAMGWHLDGRVSAVVGTHSHVQTADERILPQGTAYISDAGMTGLYDSILGVDPEGPLKRFTTQLPCRLKISKGRKLFNAVIIHINVDSGKAESIERIFQIH
jgi:hypothetical protein